MRSRARVKLAGEKKKKAAEQGGPPEPLAVSWPRQVKVYERLRRMQSSISEEKDVSGTAAADRGKARSGLGTSEDERLLSNMIKAKAMRRIAGVQRLVREGSLHLSYEELVGVRNAAKALFQEIDSTMDKARGREVAVAERRIEEQESTIRWLEMGHCIFEEQKEGLQERHMAEQRKLRRQLQEEREKALCLVCLDRPRNTLVLPCLHFQYCLDCLLQHRARNGNTCPTCRRAIEGLCMASSLAANNIPPAACNNDEQLE